MGRSVGGEINENPGIIMTEQSSIPPTFKEKDITYYFKMIKGDFSELEEGRPLKLGDSPSIRDIVIVFGSESLGEGKKTLGKKLMYLFLQSLINGPVKPKSIVLLNSAVKMAQGKTEALKKLTILEEQGARIMVCLSSAAEYAISDNIHVGFTATMDEICETIMNARKVVTL